jgi:hypothetical protein
MPHHLVAPLLSVVLASCSNDASGPSDRVLVGSWGSPEAEFIAIQAGAEARTGCTTIVIQAPVTLAENNTFTSRGELHGSGAVIGKLPVVEVFGTLTEDGLSLAAPSVAGGAPVTYLLKAGVTRSPADVPECLQ